MKTKPMIMAHGNLILPLTVGQKARYCQNGIWKTTGRVRQIIEQTEDYVKFETDSVRYCIDPVSYTHLDVYKRQVECFMMGRGVLADPSLAREIRGGKAADQSDIRRFHDLLYHTYREEVSGDRNVLFKMKEIWFYLAPMFADSKKYAKKIKKSERCVVYELSLIHICQ